MGSVSNDFSGRHLHPSLSGGGDRMTTARNFGDKYMRLAQLHHEISMTYEELAVECAQAILKEADTDEVYDALSVIDDLPDNVILFPRNPDEI